MEYAKAQELPLRRMALETRNKHILMIIENLPAPFDRRMWLEATTLHNHGYEVTIICPTGKGFKRKKEILQGIHIYRYDLPFEAKGVFGYAIEYSVAMLASLLLAVRVHLKKRIDIIHAANPPDLIFLIPLFFRLFHKVRFVFDHHDLNPELYLEKFHKRDFFYAIMVFLEKRSMQLADQVLSTNESYKEIALTRGGKNENNVFVVRTGVDISRFVTRIPNSEHKRGNRILVAFLGVIAEQDGVHLLIKAVDHIVRVMLRTDIAFTVIGDGPYRQRVMTLATQLGVADHVLFTGRINDDLMLEILSTADICVTCDTYCEMNDKSTMNKTMEYMALSKAVIQFDLTEARFTALDTCLYARPDDFVDLAEKIVLLADNSQLRKELGTKARNRIESDLQWSKNSGNLLEAYRQMD